jgi:hypothetical protein
MPFTFVSSLFSEMNGVRSIRHRETAPTFSCTCKPASAPTNPLAPHPIMDYFILYLIDVKKGTFRLRIWFPNVPSPMESCLNH